MKSYKGYLIDLDGTMYRGTEKIEEAPAFIKRLKEKGIPHLFLTNNSSKTQAQVADHLNSMDIPAEPEEIFTSSLATAFYIQEQKLGAKVYAIGGEGLFKALEQCGSVIVEEGADYVVIGLDQKVTYEKLAKACLNVRAGARLISTNGDIAIPTERGLLPGNGSITSVVAVSTEQAPLYIGKPESIIMNQALEAIGLKKEETLMIGDNYHTDIMAGIHAGMDTLMVFTGVTTKEQLAAYKQKPTYHFPTLASVMEYL